MAKLAEEQKVSDHKKFQIFILLDFSASIQRIHLNALECSLVPAGK